MAYFMSAVWIDVPVWFKDWLDYGRVPSITLFPCHILQPPLPLLSMARKRKGYNCSICPQVVMLSSAVTSKQCLALSKENNFWWTVMEQQKRRAVQGKGRDVWKESSGQPFLSLIAFFFLRQYTKISIQDEALIRY